jgi:Transposase DDE domain
MNWQNQLIFMYFNTCEFFSQLPTYQFFRISPNSSPSFTDEEVITIYVFGILQNMRTVKAIHRYIKNHLSDWFPNLPKYEGYLERLNSLNQYFIEFSDYLLKNKVIENAEINLEKLIVIDSMPIIMAKNYRAHKCKTANDIASIGYCSSKNLFYHGVKFHLLGKYQKETLATPFYLKVTAANIHDLTAIQKDLYKFKNSIIIGDKAYSDKDTKSMLKKIGTEIHTPIKLSRSKKELDNNEILYSKIVSSFRQSIEIIFSWIDVKTGIQEASKVRSSKGLHVHVYGRFSAVLFEYLFKKNKYIFNS